MDIYDKIAKEIVRQVLKGGPGSGRKPGQETGMNKKPVKADWENPSSGIKPLPHEKRKDTEARAQAEYEEEKRQSGKGRKA